MARRLPPLNALRVFEEAARHLSFTRAAAELHVTQGAVSRQVKSLESWLGTSLFHRQPGGLRLTRAAGALLPSVTTAFDGISAGVALLRPGGSELRVRAGCTLAVRWLMPRLGRFHDRAPEVSIRLTTAWDDADFTREDFDAGIMYGRPARADLRADRLLDEWLLPVCAPGSVTPRTPLATPDDLRRHTLLHLTPTHDHWRQWLSAAGAAAVDPDAGVDFDLDETALQAAVGGHGVTLANPLFVQRDVAEGRLVHPFRAPRVPTDGYFLVYPPEAAPTPALAAFRDWLLGETAPSRAP